jgi:hypothetical protein
MRIPDTQKDRRLPADFIPPCLRQCQARPNGPFCLLGLALALVTVRAQAPRGVIITGGRIADGTGGPLRRENVRIEKDHIVAAPGFIDSHNHSTSGLMDDPAAETQVAQGITTLVVGADGSSPWPIADYLAERRTHPAAVNVLVMVGPRDRAPPGHGRRL